MPVIQAWLRDPAKHLVEPFAGGGNITLGALSEKLASRATMIELDPDVAAVWQVVLNGQADWLANRIYTFALSRSVVSAELDRTPRSLRDKAWLTLLRNRVSHGGIIAAGSGFLKKGERGNGLKSRWYPETLGRRIKAVNGFKKRITFVRGDGLLWIEKNLAKLNSRMTALFIDPPYALAGQRLYSFADLDHRRLFELVSRVSCRVLMTYEDSSEVRALAREFGFRIRKVKMLSRQNVAKTELLIAKDFEWLRN
jgi:DNA adenine methylase